MREGAPFARPSLGRQVVMSALRLVEIEPGALPSAEGRFDAPGSAAQLFRRPLSEWIARFLKHLEREAKSPNTLRHYAHDLDLFSRYLKAHAPFVSAPSDVDAEIIRQYLRHLSLERGNSPASNRRRLASLRRFFGYLLSEGVIDADPCAPVSVRRAQPRPHPALTREEALRFLQAAKMSRFPARDYAMFRLFLSCGCTLSELLALRLEDFDPDQGTITFVSPRGKVRTLTLSPACLDALKEYLESRPKAPAAKSLFINRRGAPVTKGAVYHAFRQAIRRSGIDKPGVTVHSLRRTCLTLLWEAGVSLRTLQHVAGHASLSTTREYARSQNRGNNPQAWKWGHPLDG